MGKMKQGKNIFSVFSGRGVLFLLLVGVSLSLVAVSCTDKETSDSTSSSASANSSDSSSTSTGSTSNSDSSSNESNSDSNEDLFGAFLEAAQGAVKSGNLSLNDFPAGWTSTPSVDSDDFDLHLSEKCEILEAGRIPGEVAEAESDDFTGPNEQSVSSSTTVVTSTAAAKSAIDDFIEAFSLQECKDEVEAGFVKLFKDGQGIDAEITVRDVSFPRIGESSTAFRVLISVPDFDFEMMVDMVMAKQGKMLGTLSLSSPVNGKLDPDEESEIGAKFAAKLKAAEATLPN